LRYTVPDRPQLIDSKGEMAEWSIAHAWKSKLASDTKPFRRGSRHRRSAT